MKSKTYKENLLTKLKNKEYRDAFVSEHIDTGIPFQIKALREQRNLLQKDLEKLGMKQSLISRLENLSYSGYSLSTLKKIASIFDIGLIVRFVAISDLVKWELNLNTESLKVLSYEDDPYFKVQGTDITATSGTVQYATVHISDKTVATVADIKEEDILRTKTFTISEQSLPDLVKAA